MTTKLHIDISQGILDVEGDPELVREVYRDFRDQLIGKVGFGSSTPTPSPADTTGNAETASDTNSKPKAKRRAPKKKSAGDDSGSGVFADSPKLDKNLDTSGLDAFYSQYEAKRNADKIVVFLKFMTETLGIENPNTDQVYTCFKATGSKIPTAFAQAFYDTSSKLGYIDYRSSTELPVTIAGDNHFNHSLKKAEVE
jgi:hypothetical protein